MDQEPPIKPMSNQHDKTIDFLDDQIGVLGRERDAAVARHAALIAALDGLAADWDTRMPHRNCAAIYTRCSRDVRELLRPHREGR